MAIKGGIKNLNQIKRELDKMRKAPQKALTAIEADIRERAPKWIAAGVADRYALEGAKNNSKKAVLSGNIGSLAIRGSIRNNTMQLVYSGRPLTPVHFNMKPTGTQQPGAAYTLKWKVLRVGKGTTAKIKKLTKNSGRT